MCYFILTDFYKVTVKDGNFGGSDMPANHSVEPNIANLVNGWLRDYKLPVKLEQESLNPEIDSALNEYFSKTGGSG